MSGPWQAQDCTIPDFDTVTPERIHRHFILVKAGDLEPRALDWLVSGLFERDTLLMLFGDPGAGKSFMALDLSCCIASGADYHGKTVKQGHVVYICGEGLNGVIRRLQAWCIRNQVKRSELPLYISQMPAALSDINNLVSVLEAIDDIGEPPALIVVDTLARSFGPGDENSTADMTAFVRACDELRVAYGCTVALIHHSGHGDKSRSRGSSVLNGAVDTSYQLSRDNDLIKVKSSKMKDGPAPDPFAFEFRTVELGMKNEDGTEATSAILYPVDVPDKPTQATGKHQKHALDCLDKLFQAHRANLAKGGLPAETARVTLTDWRDACTADGMPRPRWYDAKASLIDIAVIEIDGRFVSRRGPGDDD